MGSHGVILATAMAVSGTVVLFVLCRQRPIHSPVDEGAALLTGSPLQPCISGSKKSEGKAAKKRQKRVHFAEKVVELPAGGCNAEEGDESFGPSEEEAPPESLPVLAHCWSECGRQVRGDMPANRMALYNGILRNRHLRMACSY